MSWVADLTISFYDLVWLFTVAYGATLPLALERSSNCEGTYNEVWTP